MEDTVLSFWLLWDWPEEWQSVTFRFLLLPPPRIINIMKAGLCDTHKSPGTTLTVARAGFKFYENRSVSPLRSAMKVQKLAMSRVEIYFCLYSSD